MNRREFLNAVISNTLTPEVIEFATAEIAKLDASNAKAKEKRNSPDAKPTAAQIANKEIFVSIKGVLTTAPMSANAIAEKLGLTVAKVGAVIRSCNDGSVDATDIKEGKTKHKGYFLKTTGAEVDIEAEVEG